MTISCFSPVVGFLGFGYNLWVKFRRLSQVYSNVCCQRFDLSFKFSFDFYGDAMLFDCIFIPAIYNLATFKICLLVI